MPYTYRPLDTAKGEIRLLSIEACSDGIAKYDASPIRCSLDHVQSSHDLPLKGKQVKLDSEHSPWGIFAALSYEWGKPEPRQAIILNEEPFEVTPNLFHALLRVRQAAINDGRPYIKLWADAICINQSNIDERNLQVPRMRYIYSSAHTVYCYVTPVRFGDDDKLEQYSGDPFLYEREMEKAVAIIRELAEIPESREEALFTALYQNRDEFSGSHWRALQQFYASSYWRRLWVVQEIALASHSICILAGTHVLDFEIALRTALVLSNGVHVITLQALGHEALADIGLLRMDIAKRGSNLVDPDIDFRTLFRTALLQTTDPRDKVYAILGLLDPAQANTIAVNYQKAVDEVYTDLASSMIEYTGSLKTFLFCKGPPRDSNGRPSWVPDLRCDRGPVPMTLFEVSKRLNHLDRPFINSNSSVVVPGIYADEVDTISASYSRSSHLLNPETPRGVIISTNAGQSGHAYGCLDGLKDALWSTLSCRLNQDADEPYPITKDLLESMSPSSVWAQVLRVFFNVNQNLVLAGYTLESFFADSSDSKIESLLSVVPEAQWDAIFNIMCTMMGYRRLNVHKKREAWLGSGRYQTRRCNICSQGLRPSGGPQKTQECLEIRR